MESNSGEKRQAVQPLSLFPLHSHLQYMQLLRQKMAIVAIGVASDCLLSLMDLQSLLQNRVIAMIVNFIAVGKEKATAKI